MSILGLIVTALILVFFEVILPGGILGIIAVICVIIATWMTGAEYGAGAATLVFTGSALAIGLLTYLEFKILARTSLGNRIFLKSTVTGHSNRNQSEDSIIGKEGTAITRLNPAGKVAIGEQSFDAHSQDGYIDAGTPVRVVKQDSFQLIIQKL